MSARELAVDVLLRVEQDNAYSHIALDYALDAAPLDARDRGLVTRMVYGTLCFQRRLDAELDEVMKKPPEPYIRAVLRTALYQMRYLERVPTHAIVNEAVELATAKRGKRVGGFVNAILRRLDRDPPKFRPPSSPHKRIAFENSLPTSLIKSIAERGLDDAELERWAASQNLPAPLTLRVNTSRIAPAKLIERLGGGEIGRWLPDAIQLEAASPELRGAIHEGLCRVQDEGSQLVGALVGAQDGPVWDACAGQGGKALQMAEERALGRGSGTLWVSDLHSSKLDRLTELVHAYYPKQALEVRAADVRHWQEDVSFAAVLLDAPCSGLGLVRRHPEMRLRFDRRKIAELATLQSELLDAVAPHVAEGGILVYAVCTNTTAEGPEQVTRFLDRHAEFERTAPPESPSVAWDALCDDAHQLDLWSHRHGTDGFFAVRLRRKT